MFLKFPDEISVSPACKDLIQRLMCDVDDRLGTQGVQDIKAHPFFAGVQWETLHAARAPYTPRVDHELDTQNFERFDEDAAMASPSGGAKKWAKADPNFIGYTYKNWEAVHQGPEAAASLPGQVVMKKKAARPSLQQLQSTMESMSIEPGQQQH